MAEEPRVKEDQTGSESLERNPSAPNGTALEGTLMEITHNMGQMADLMAKIYTKFGDDDSGPPGHRHNMTNRQKRARDDSPPDESECSDSQGELESKRRKSSRGEQDRLSLRADEDGDETIFLKNKSLSLVPCMYYYI